MGQRQTKVVAYDTTESKRRTPYCEKSIPLLGRIRPNLQNSLRLSPSGFITFLTIRSQVLNVSACCSRTIRVER